MKILSLSIDNKVLDPKSAVSHRARQYGELVERYDVVVPAGRYMWLVQPVVLSPHVTAYGVIGMDKIKKAQHVFFRANSLLKVAQASGHSYDLITVQDPVFIGYIAQRLARKFKTALEVQVHGFENMGGMFSSFKMSLARKVFAQADTVRVVSKRLKEKIMLEFGVPEAKITVLPIFTDTVGATDTGNSAVISEQKHSVQKPIFLTVSRLVPVKNIALQIAAFAHVLKEIPHAELHIVGEGPLRKKLECQAQSAGEQVARQVKFFGWEEGEVLERHYRSASAFVLTSQAEGWGMAVIEATAHGAPVVMTDVGCAGEAIIHEESGIVLPVNVTSEVLAKQLVRIAEDHVLQAHFSQNAFEMLKKLPTKEQTLASYKKGWEKAVSSAASNMR